MEENNFKIRDSVKIKIVHELIEPFYLDDIKSMIRGKKCWKLSGQVFETVSKILVAVGGIISFSSGYFNDPILSFLAGSISTLSLATLQFSSFAYMENKKQGQDLNVLLKKLNLDVIPVLERRTDSVQPPLMNERRSQNIIAVVDDEVIVPKIIKEYPQPLPPSLSVGINNDDTIIPHQNNKFKIPSPPSAEDGLIVSEYTPLTTDLKEQKS
jgi:hypothetical protein